MKPTHGGKRQGAGRPPAEGERIRVSPTLTEAQLAALDEARREGESRSAALLRLAGL